MGCEALHSHLLLGLMIIHAVIVMYLFSSKMFFIFPKKSTSNTTVYVALGKEEYDLNGVKVIIGIIVHCLCFISLLGSLLANNVKTLTRKLPPVVITITLVFSLVINIAGAFCLWFHNAPHHPGGVSRTVRGSAQPNPQQILSSITLVVTLGISVLFCIHPPPHDSLRATPSAEALGQDVGGAREKKESKDKKMSWFRRKEVSAEPTPMDVPGDVPAPAPPPPAPALLPAPPPPPPPPPPPLPPPPPQPLPPPQEKKPTDGEGLYENLEVPPGGVPLPPPPPP
ncbi:hypothetical protein Aduo_011007 [Ancylostoma duodenale]